MEIELEKTFLVKELPKDIKDCESFEILDIYLPYNVEHPILRIRKIGEGRFEMTKKSPVKDGDSSEQSEETIILSEKEFKELSSSVKGKRLRKIRYFYPWEGVKGDKADIDVFLDNFKGLVIADFEFDSCSEKENFKMPDFCLADFTQEKATAGGWLAGREYSDIAPVLEKYGYKGLEY